MTFQPYSSPEPLTGPAENEAYLEKEIHLRDYLRVLRKRKATIFMVFLIVMVLVVLATFTATPIYRASAKVLIEKSEKNPLMTNYGYVQYDPEFMETQIQVITSTPVAIKVVNQLNLVDTYDSFFEKQKDRITAGSLMAGVTGWFKDLWSTSARALGLGGGEATDTEDQAGEEAVSEEEMIARALAGGIVVEPVRDSRILSISYMSPSPVLSRMVVNAVAKAFMEKILEMKMESSGYTIRWMTEKADEERTKLERSERALQQYMKENDIVTVENRIAITPQRLSELNTRLTQSEARRKELAAVYRQVKHLSGNYQAAESIQMIVSDPAIQALRGQILEAEKKIMDLSKKYGPKHPVMKRARSDLEVLRRKRLQEIRRMVTTIKNEYQLARDQEQELSSLLSETKSKTVHLNEKFIQYNMLKREVETNRQLYDALVAKIKEQGVSEQVQSVKVWVVEKARTPEFPAKPRKGRNLMLGIILGLFGGIGLAFFVEYLDNTIKYPDDVEDRFGLPVLGAVALNKDKKSTPELIVDRDSSSTVSENYRSVRTAVMLSSSQAPPERMMVSSMSPSEGKTTTASNLAITFAQAGKKVLLIDGDMRRPRVHRIFSIPSESGLSTYLAGTSRDNIYRQSDIENLSLIPAGPTPPNPSELLSGPRFSELLSAATKKFDIIICDAPPVLTVSDSLILAKNFDGTILVTRAGKTTFDVFARGLKTLAEVDIRVLGVVLNAVEMKKSEYYYYYNRYYSSYETK